MYEYEQRYIEVSRFVSYCKSLNINVSKQELEFYEREKLLFPAVRVVIPDDYVKYMFDIKHNPLNLFYGKIQYELPDKWVKIHRLLDRINLPIFHKNIGPHHFDKQFGKNKYLIKPSENLFREWNSYKTKAGKIGNSYVSEDTARHYYHYWQIYQIYEIQKYLDYCSKRTLEENIKIIKKRYPLYYHISFSRKKVADGDYLGLNNDFEALSIFIRLSNKKKMEIIDKAKPIDGGYKRLSKRQFTALEKANEKIAISLTQKFNLDEKKLFDFLRNLLKLHIEYERAEKLKLSREIQKDISYLVRLIMYKTKLKFQDISKQIGRLGGYFENYLDVVFLNQLEKAKERALPTLNGFLKEYNSAFANHQLSQDNFERLLMFCERNNLLSLLYSISDLNKEWFDRDILSETVFISHLRECACFPERLGELIAKKTRKRNIKLLLKKRIILKTVVRLFFSKESWVNNLIKIWNDRSNFNTYLEFEQKYHFLLQQSRLRQDKEEDNIFRTVLLTSLVRNYIIHRNASFAILEENFIIILRSIVYVIFSIWNQAEKRNLLTVY